MVGKGADLPINIKRKQKKSKKLFLNLLQKTNIN